MEYTYADVIIANKVAKLDRVFQYRIPHNIMEHVKVGCRVEVPFGMGNQLRTGFVMAIGNPLEWDANKVKDIQSVLDEKEAISEELIELAKWMKDRYLATLASCFQAIIPKQFIQKEIYLTLGKGEDVEEAISLIRQRGYKRQVEIIDFMEEKTVVALKDLKRALRPQQPVIKRLLDKGILVYGKPEPTDNYLKDITLEKPFALSYEQKNIFDAIKPHIQRGGYEEYLIHGVTGSGKTEVYMQLIEEVLACGKSAIVLVPEISLTPQMVHKFTRRYGDLVGVTHSRLNQTERLDVWNRARNGKIRIVLGPRSAVFTPFRDLGMIIIDEEHELTYKSDVHPKYQTAEVARKRCMMNKGILLLGSATPSVTTYFSAMDGQMHYFPMHHRVNATLPQVDLVDMRLELEEGNKSILSRRLHEAITERLQKGEQTILFLNRRGHSTFVSCRSCGFVFKCPHCELPYTYHYSRNVMQCHHCGKMEQVHKNCPSCGSKYVKYFGTGTQKVEQFIQNQFPKARILRMDLDTTGRKHAHEQFYKQFHSGEADILIGTQMIAKGLDFPGVTLVGVIAADLSLYGGDYRAAERTYQLLTQVAGRAGRNSHHGEVLIQTYSPEHYAVQSALHNDYEMFYEQEIQFRQLLEFPPYTHILSFLIQHHNEELVIKTAQELGRVLKYYGEKKDFEVIGPSPASRSKLKNNYRWHIIVKHKEYERLRNYAKYCLEVFDKYKDKDVQILYDLNPSMIQ